MVKKHDHEFVRVVAGFAEPEKKPAAFKACAICGKDDPNKPRPAGALDHPPGWVEPEEDE